MNPKIIRGFALIRFVIQNYIFRRCAFSILNTHNWFIDKNIGAGKIAFSPYSELNSYPKGEPFQLEVTTYSMNIVVLSQ